MYRHNPSPASGSYSAAVSNQNIMSGSSNLKKAQLQLRDAGASLAPTVREALELWLQTVDDLPQHMQHPSTATATGLVQAALLQARTLSSDNESKQLSWLGKHLPGISTAMKEIMNNQLQVCSRRFSILQSLAKASPQSGNAQLAGRIDAECSVYDLLQVHVLLYYIILPAATLCDAWSGRYREDVHCSHDSKQRAAQQCSGVVNQVLMNVASSADVRVQMDKQLKQIDQHLEELGVAGSELQGDAADRILHARQLLFCASYVWVQLATELQAGRAQRQWALLGAYCPIFGLDWDEPTKALIKSMLSQMQQIISAATSWMLSAANSYKGGQESLVKAFHMLKPQAFQVPGLPANEQQQLMSLMQKAGVDMQPVSLDMSGSCSDQPADKQPSASSDSTADDSQGTDHSNALSPDHDSTAPAAAGDDGLNDMQALLQLMYGCTVKEGQA